MTIIQEPHIRCKEQSVSDEYRKWVFERMPAMGRLLDQLDAGRSPDALDVMGGLSEMVAFSTDCEKNDYAAAQLKSLLPGKSCSSC